MARPMEIVMKPFLLAALQTILRALIGALNYERVKMAVESLESRDLSGEEKRTIVLNEAASVIEVVGKALVNLAIEAAVNSLRSK